MSSPALTNAALVQAARQSDPNAWKHLVERYDGMIRDICRAYRLDRSEVDDLRQTVWMRAVEHLDRLHDPQRIGSWLARVARNECLRMLQQAARVQPRDGELFEALPDTRESPDEQALASERRRIVRNAIVTLSPRDRALLDLLYHQSEPSYTDIGEALNMPIGSIGPTRGRVLERLRRCDGVVDFVAAG
jgi:RNA polymerase sigma factor (sigma-70 family)